MQSDIKIPDDDVIYPARDIIIVIILRQDFTLFVLVNEYFLYLVSLTIKKNLVHIACGIMSSTATNSVSVEFLIIRFYLMSVLVVDTFTSYWVDPMSELQWGCTLCNPSTHHLTVLVLYDSRVSDI